MNGRKSALYRAIDRLGETDAEGNELHLSELIADEKTRRPAFNRKERRKLTRSLIRQASKMARSA